MKSFALALFLITSQAIAADAGLSVTYGDYDGVPLTDCSFDDASVHNGCKVDTGSNGSQIPASLNMWSEKYPDVNRQRSLLASGAPDECIDLSIFSLKMGAIPMNPTSVARCTAGTVGVIGVAAFDGGSFRFDFKHHLIQDDRNFASAKDQLKRDSFGYAYVPVQVGGRTIFALIDTGISMDGAVDPTFVRNNPTHFKKGPKVSGSDGAGIESSFDTYELDAMDLGNGHILTKLNVVALDQPDLWQVFNQAGSPLLLGIGALSHYVWHLNFKNNVWSLE